MSRTIGELDPLIGRTISGRYRVHALIGQGGMGKVFEAQQIPLGRSVALKVLSTSQTTETDTEFQQRFFHEASILARLRSPHTVTVFDYGRDGDIFFIAMELVTGKAFDRLLREVGVLQPPHALSVAIQIARSLREAHALGVVHRDLKPANVLIARTADGEEHIKVLDFGLAKRLTLVSQKEDTSRNVVPGSPKYMAPEVIRQEDVDGRADIYALGIMLYHMLVGRVPFDADNPLDILMAHLHNAPTPLAQVRPNARVPQELEALVMRCLAKRPEERFANMQELIDALRAIGRTIGAEEGMHNPMSILPPSMTTGTGNTPSPAQPPNRSNRPGAAGNPRTSEPVRLRLDNFEATPSGTQVRKAPVKRSLILPIAIATACGVIGALLVWLLVGPGQGTTSPPTAGGVTATPLPAPPEPSVAPIVQPSTAEADKAQAEEAPVMEFTEQELEASRRPAADTTRAAATVRAELPSVMITARSVPPGAAVLVRGTRMGLSPVTFRFQDAQAKQGQAIAVTFQLKGYASKTVRQPIAGEELLVDAVLVAEQPAQAAPAEDDEPEQEEGAAEDALLDIEKRARELEVPAADSVLKITETPTEE